MIDLAIENGCPFIDNWERDGYPRKGRIFIMGKRSPAFSAPVFPDDDSTPDIYADGMGVTGGPTGFALLFTLTKGNPPGPKPVAVFRVSPQQIAVMAKVLRSIVENFERQVGEIALPPDLIPPPTTSSGEA